MFVWPLTPPCVSEPILCVFRSRFRCLSTCGSMQDLIHVLGPAQPVLRILYILYIIIDIERAEALPNTCISKLLSPLSCKQHELWVFWRKLPSPFVPNMWPGDMCHSSSTDQSAADLCDHFYRIFWRTCPAGGQSEVTLQSRPQSSRWWRHGDVFTNLISVLLFTARMKFGCLNKTQKWSQTQDLTVRRGCKWSCFILFDFWTFLCLIFV